MEEFCSSFLPRDGNSPVRHTYLLHEHIFIEWVIHNDLVILRLKLNHGIIRKSKVKILKIKKKLYELLNFAQ